MVTTEAEGAERKTACPYLPKDHDLAGLMRLYPGADCACEGVASEAVAEGRE